jgi:hypothetical protein
MRAWMAAKLRKLARIVERKRASPPDATTLGRLVVHIAYEVAALEAASTRCPNWVALEAFLLHTRNLRGFFLSEWRAYAAYASEDVYAENYFSHPDIWRNVRAPSPTLCSTRKAIDKQLAHIGRKRALASGTQNLLAAVASLTSEVQALWGSFLPQLATDPYGRRFHAPFQTEYATWKGKL